MFRNNKGVSLISVLVIVIIVLIIASISIINGTRHIEEANSTKKQQELAAVQSAVNAISLKQSTAGVFSPAGSGVYGTPIREAHEIDSSLTAGYSDDWYVLQENDLEQMGLSYITDTYAVNYKTGEVKLLTEYVKDSPNNYLVVNFNANGGSVDTQNKKIYLGDNYGDLPTPTRDGYAFVGWRGNNLVPELTEENFIAESYRSRTPNEFLDENGTKYIRFYGNSSQTNIDTSWWLYEKNSMNLQPNKQYILSFYVRSENSISPQQIKKRTAKASTGNTGIYSNINMDFSNLITTVEDNLSFENDGNWHKLTSRIIIPSEYDEYYLAIGNDTPNLYGPNSYIDIKDIRLEEVISSSTEVAQSGNYNLTAAWEEDLDDGEMIVTFNANGGSVNTAEKVVTYGGTYGSLPVPTREGYTFKGWNGKNKFDKSKYLYLDDYPTYINWYNWSEIALEANKTYKVSIIRYNNFDGKVGTVLLAKAESPGTDGKWTSIAHSSAPNTSHGEVPFQYTMDENGILYIGYHSASTSQNTLDTIWANTDVQIEEGSKATAYEPYYITSSTEVVQQKNHTLTAIWEKN